MPQTKPEPSIRPQSTSAVSGGITEPLRSLSVQVGPFVVEVLIDDAGRFRGVARVSVDYDFPGVGNRRVGSFEGIEKYYGLEDSESR